jgi:hypothetical protein
MMIVYTVTVTELTVSLLEDGMSEKSSKGSPFSDWPHLCRFKIKPVSPAKDSTRHLLIWQVSSSYCNTRVTIDP